MTPLDETDFGRAKQREDAMRQVVDQRLMRLAAEKQATERATRDGVWCYVFVRENHPEPGAWTWYVRAEGEGRPLHAQCVFSVQPQVVTP